MAINMKYRSLKAFLLVTESHSFTHAANSLNVTQPSLSALIKDLENTLGVRLFERTTRSLALTKAGEDFLARIERPLADLEEAYRSMEDLSEVRRGVLVLGTLPSGALTLIPPILQKLKREKSRLQINVVEAYNDQLIEMLRANQVDFAIATILDSGADLEFLPLISDTFVVAYPSNHPIDKLPSLTLGDLVPYDLVLLSHGSNARRHFDHAVRGSLHRPGRRYDVTHMVTAVHMVRQGLGLTLLPSLALPGLHLEGIKTQALAGNMASRKVGVLHRRDRSLTPAASLFIRQLQEVASDIGQKPYD